MVILDANFLKQALAKGLVVIVNAKCSIEYNGRASSQANEAWRLIIIKPDGSLLIHTNEGYQPLNWQPPGSNISFKENQIIAIRHNPKETLKITMHEVAWIETAIASEGEFTLHGSHEDVKKWVIENLAKVTNCQNARLVGTEVPLNNHGKADIIAECDGNKIIIEVKRGIVDLNAVSQLKRYVNAIPEAKGVLVGAWFTSGALELAKEFGFRTVEISDILQTDHLMV
jgi:RecB family endonuclease NucS